MNDTLNEISREELAQMRGVSLVTVDNWRKIGLSGVKLRAHLKNGRRVYFTPAEVDRFFYLVEKRRGMMS